MGAGDGSVARWLARRVGPQGRVVATDIDPRFLAGPALAGVEVRRHDIRRDPLETGHYDLVHCRLLLIEESDTETFAGVDPAHPAAAIVDRVHRLTTEALQARRIDLYLGRRCPNLLERLGLAEVGAERMTWRGRGGDVEARFGQMSLEHLIQGTGLISLAEYEEVQRAYADPAFAFVPMAMVGAWGQRVAEVA